MSKKSWHKLRNNVIKRRRKTTLSLGKREIRRDEEIIRNVTKMMIEKINCKDTKANLTKRRRKVYYCKAEYEGKGRRKKTWS